ncbi:hypothetical protein TOPH_08284 [Tolypocladium ophioglossoides CBS 100239]|uniref:Cyclin-dependent kinase n=1 Tax=Tolypocladium ophioglossoides (strain CBS 100239) TaxID=1163406 RepID=A0A0L0MYZ2_TOLOC|nr:hypothetical protein TOPH_08284 [Tolypocladium ophioglossoides CBS 100239]
MSQPSPSALDTAARNAEITATSATGGERSRHGGTFAAPSAPAHVAAKQQLQDDNSMDIDSDATTTQRQLQDGQSQHHPHQMAQDSGASSSQSLTTRSVTNSQESTVKVSTDQVVTPPASDTSSGLDMSGVLGGGPNGKSAGGGPVTAGEGHHGAASQISQLLHLSAIAAAQDRIIPDAMGGGSRKRMADGEVKERGGSMSPVKGHSRTTSAISMASTAGSHIGELSAELRTRLSYAMVKVNHGWQSRSQDEVESLASQAVSPTSSTSTVHRRHGSSASPRLPLTSGTPQVHFAYDPVMIRRKSNSPPLLTSNKPTLAPPAPIQPSMSIPSPRSNPRRNSNPRYTPTMLSHSHSASPRTPGQPPRLDTSNPISQVVQDAAESLLFMSSPGNSSNLKHTFSPSGSPGTQPIPPRSTGGRHALPSGPRKALPSQRPAAFPSKKLGFDKCLGMPPPPDSPMDLDTPQAIYLSPNKGTPRRRPNGTSNHVRAALSLPSGLGLGNGTARKTLRDEDIERMLDRAGAEGADSSDDEEIQLPPGRRGVAGVMGA